MIARDRAAPRSSSTCSGPPVRGARILRLVGLALLGTLLLWASAKVQVPFYPVPMTLQTAGRPADRRGLRLAPRRSLPCSLYLVEGAFGLPVFAGTPERGIGLAYMAGPTGGYLVGFAVVAAIAGLGGRARPRLARLRRRPAARDRRQLRARSPPGSPARRPGKAVALGAGRSSWATS